MKNERNWNLDLIRTVAVLQVLTVHYFSNIGFLQQPLTGPVMVLGIMLRAGMMTCVPLFLMLSGWLCIDWRWSRAYYWKGARVLAVYLLSSAACLLYKALFLDGSRNPLIWCREVLNFNAAPYSWYIEMYLGLFLLIPFLNAAWHGVGESGQKALTATLAALAILPTLTNLSRYTVWQVQLTPAWWEKLYPLAYYCLGAWLREHPLRRKKGTCLLLAALLAVVSGGLHVWKAGGGLSGYLDVTYWHGLLTACAAVLVFSALLQVDGTRWPAMARRAVSAVAALSLTVYLVSWIPDQMVAPWITAHISAMGLRLLAGLAAIPVTLLLAAGLAWLLRWPEQWMLSAVKRLHKETVR